jgi:hypothetical protein
MKQPSAAAFVLGHIAVCASVVCIAGFLVYGWLSGEAQMSWLVPAVAVALGLKALQARREVTAYRSWQANWSRISGVPEATPLWKKPWADALWVGLLAFRIWHPYTDPSLVMTADNVASVNAAIAWGLALLSLWIVAKRVWKTARWLWRRSTSSATGKPHIVRVCLPVPRNAPEVNPAMISALPGYCRALLQHTLKE